MNVITFPNSVVKTHRQYAFARRDIIPSLTDCVWKIERGIVRTLTWDNEGTIFTLGFWGEGGIVGQPLSQAHPFQIQCLTQVKVSQLRSGEEWEDCRLLSQLQKVEAFLIIMHHKSVGDRLIGLLNWLSQRFGQDVLEGRLLPLRLTHQEIAETIGTTRVTVSRLLNQFERTEKIQRSHEYRGLIVKPLGLKTQF